MSTIEDFENAPVGATATNEYGLRAMKLNYEGRWAVRSGATWVSDDMERFGYTLDQPAPTTAQEALDLAWELAHPVKARQVIPEGTACLYRLDDGYQIHKTPEGMIARESWTDIRTLDPLPEPLPDWLDARAVLAAMDECSWQKVWFSKFDGYWECTCCGDRRHWTELTDVTQLYPKENEK